MVAVIAGVPLVLPGVLSEAGAALGRIGPVTALVAGRGMEWDPVRTARPFAGGTAILVIALAGSGYLAFLRRAEPSSSSGTAPHAAIVQWLAPQPGDHARLADALGAGLVAPMREARDGTLVIGTTCPDLVRYFPGTSCRRAAPFALPTAMERSLVASLGLYGTKIRLAAPSADAASGTALVLDSAPTELLQERVQIAATRLLPAPTVVSRLTWVLKESPLVAWISGGVLAALIALAVGSLVSMIDRLLATRVHRRHLLALGLGEHRLIAIETWLFAAPYGASIVIGFLAGLALCAMIVDRAGADMPWSAVQLVLGIAVAGGLMGTAGVALIGVRSVGEEGPGTG
jgi:hypothetical protein